MYTDQFSELVVIDIHNIAEAMELSRKEGVFPNSGNLPDPNSGYFQCPDPNKAVEGWVRDSMFVLIVPFNPMKNMKNIIVYLVLAVLSITSCSKDASPQEI
ncbi:MAG: hypothetical protein IPI60_17525 [Saprospiraceae bacterium]|nr:hypothetical protein [Saprospiraceae bacterium]